MNTVHFRLYGGPYKIYSIASLFNKLLFLTRLALINLPLILVVSFLIPYLALYPALNFHNNVKAAIWCGQLGHYNQFPSKC